MSLGTDRRKFTHMLSRLIIYAEDEGYGIAGKWWYRPPDSGIGHKESLHHDSLAVDFDLYDQDGKYLPSGLEHGKLHDFWDAMGGNERIRKDMNHYSYGGTGVR